MLGDPEIFSFLSVFFHPISFSSMSTPNEDLPYPGIKPGSPILQADSLPPEPSGNPDEFWSTPVFRDQEEKVEPAKNTEKVANEVGREPEDYSVDQVKKAF